MKKIIILLLVSLSVNFTQSVDCHWGGWPLCGLLKRCGNDILVQYEFRRFCFINSFKYCCPRPAGKNLILCEHQGFGGHCISYSVEENKCANVDITYWASSVDTFENCFRVYNGRDCTGKSIAVYPGLKGTDDLTKLGFDDQVISVSNCFEADREVDHCKGTEGSADENCKWIIKPLTIGRLPMLKVESNVSAPVRYYQRAPNNRTEFMAARVETDNLGTGTRTNQETAWYVRVMGRSSDIAGYLLDQRLGGSGTDLRNIIPQNPNIGRAWAQVENFVYKVASTRGSVLYTVNVEYENDNATRPIRLYLEVRRADTGEVLHLSSLVNP